MMQKKLRSLTALALAAALLFTLTSCGREEPPAETTAAAPETTTSSAPPETTTAAAEEPEEEPALRTLSLCTEGLELYCGMPGLYLLPEDVGTAVCFAVEDRLVYVDNEYSIEYSGPMSVTLKAWDPVSHEVTAEVKVASNGSEQGVVHDGKLYFHSEAEGGCLVCFDRDLNELGRYPLPEDMGSYPSLFGNGESVYISDWENGIVRLAFPDGGVEFSEHKNFVYNRCDAGVDTQGRFICVGEDSGLVRGLYACDPASGSCERIKTRFMQTGWYRASVAGDWFVMHNGTDSIDVVNVRTGEEHVLENEDMLEVFSIGNGMLLSCTPGPESELRLSVYNRYGRETAGLTLGSETGAYSILAKDSAAAMWNECGAIPMIIYADEGAKSVIWVPESGSGEGRLKEADAEWSGRPSPYGELPGLTELYERAAEIGEEYGIALYIADTVPERVAEYNTDQLTDPALLSDALDSIETILDAYPEGFFSQLVYGTFGYNAFFLTAGLTTEEAGMVSSAGGVVSDDGFRHVLAIVYNEWDPDGFVISLNHEISHLVDRRLAYRSMVVEDALFSEDGWNALNPEGFSYTCSYNDYWDNDWISYVDYFMDSYAMTFPTEDRARLFGEAMYRTITIDGGGYFPEPFFAEGPFHDKMDYYSRCIRDGFDTDGWPEQTAWERTY